MKKISFFFGWLSATFLTFILAVLALNFSALKPKKTLAFQETTNFAVLGAYDYQSPSIVGEDARPTILATFLKKYRAAMTPHDLYAREFVAMADKYGLDFRLLPAIAMQESNLCRKAPAGSNNCWGHGIYGGKVTTYTSLLEAMESVAKTLSRYSKKGLASPEEIMRRYTPQSEGEWAAGVLHFMAEMR